MSEEIQFHQQSGLGVISLNRPDVLNALSLEMCLELDQKLSEWESDDSIQAVIIRGEGGKAFCAGGDVRTIVEQGFENNQMADEFFATEYKMNARIHHFKKPYIALLDGIVMGGGVGVSIHGSHRIVTEKTLFAMPESAIGLIPDVGGSYFLPRLPGSLGKYLGLTGARLKGSDVLYAGIGTAYMSSEKLEEFVATLMQEDISSDEDVDQIIARFAEDPGEAPIDEFRDLIDAAFSETTMEDILDHLSDIDHDWARETGAVLNKMSPISLKVIVEQLNRGAKLEFDDCMIMEYRIVAAISSYDSDFYEGVRAVLIDKDHNPNWVPPTLSEVSHAMVMAHFDVPKSGDLEL
ncbi:enoyl-CoA hydratase/isomerase family protein [Pseudemcibacter aquimaris]|uniref:enoyl-CoA hydratase/isomerase family protein n=1 Tax=Pseudemcibacter aquimaris TaxID=2857064 RepID=UPI00201142B3|nr:enoyl-CoA hydratase/isomerase family protein [Pseudemcibacter aquimaris]MCC3862025.1 enoyl-CoA hydratase/isomerase family protein [Pseudemcibacter aquimaris]WDU58777.1 enoyl-CoA hydratase/isomerase family protein [Pseudemcibacter aquimaris]